MLLVGGGTYFVFFSKFRPYRYIAHSIGILTGKYDDPNTPGDINHFQALSTALAATVGMGNISGVAIAITVGGPGAIFWMWVSAVVGMSDQILHLYPGRYVFVARTVPVKNSRRPDVCHPGRVG